MSELHVKAPFGVAFTTSSATLEGDLCVDVDRCDGYVGEVTITFKGMVPGENPAFDDFMKEGEAQIAAHVLSCLNGYADLVAERDRLKKMLATYEGRPTYAGFSTAEIMNDGF